MNRSTGISISKLTLGCNGGVSMSFDNRGQLWIWRVRGIDPVFGHIEGPTLVSLATGACTDYFPTVPTAGNGRSAIAIGPDGAFYAKARAVLRSGALLM